MTVSMLLQYMLFLGFFATLMCFGVLHFFPRMGLMDRPHRYGHDRAPIPYPGGAALLVTFIVGFLLFFPKTPLTWAVFGTASLLSGLAFLDDRLGLSPFLRLGAQGVGALSLVFFGLGVHSVPLPFMDSLLLTGWISAAVTIFWIVVMINALNWIDGIPGMASGTTAVAALVLFVLSVRPDFHFADQTLSILLSLMVFVLACVFLCFDFPKPKMLLGDTGSMLFGLLLSVLALISGGKVATTALVLGFPLLDFFWVIARRLWRGQSPFRGDLLHFHHRLQKAGYSDRVIVTFFMLSALVFGSLALLLQSQGKWVAFLSIFVFMLLVAFFLYSKRTSD